MATDEILPFNVPAYVLVDRGAREGNLHAEPVLIGALDAATLAELCTRFRAGVFARAGQADPAVGPPALTGPDGAALWPVRYAAGAVALPGPPPLSAVDLEALRLLEAELAAVVDGAPPWLVCAALALRLARELAAATTDALGPEEARRVTETLLSWAWAQAEDPAAREG